MGRGGDPEKSDHFGNTALHLASSRGHLNCVTFLVNFGVNMFVQDIDNHTPQELAAMNDCTEIIKYLDLMAAKKESDDAKTVKRQKEQAEKDVQKLIANFKKVQKKADRMSSQKVKDLEEKTKKVMKQIIYVEIRNKRTKVNYRSPKSQFCGIERFTKLHAYLSIIS